MSTNIRSLMPDVLGIIIGLSLMLIGGLIATIYVGIANMVVSSFVNISKTTVTNYVTSVATYVPMILQMLGLSILIVAVVHIIMLLLQVARKPGEAAGV